MGATGHVFSFGATQFQQHPMDVDSYLKFLYVFSLSTFRDSKIHIGHQTAHLQTPRIIP
jgi:hypothetical protein